jgi:signal transduction histidine kinase
VPIEAPPKACRYPPGGTFESLPQSGSPRRVPPYKPRLTIRTGKTNGTITIEIEDNGPGIPDDIKDKILQLFYTTKKGTQGTGLGLSITDDIIKAHGGRLEIQQYARRKNNIYHLPGKKSLTWIPERKKTLKTPTNES